MPFTKANASAMGKKGGMSSKRKPFDNSIRDWLETEKELILKDGEKPEMISVNDLFKRVILREALKGNVKAIQLAWERGYGKPEMSVEVKTNPDENYLKLLDDLNKDKIITIKPDLPDLSTTNKVLEFDPKTAGKKKVTLSKSKTPKKKITLKHTKKK